MKKAPPHHTDKRQTNDLIREQQQPLPSWRQPRFCFLFIIATFSCNLLIAIVTIERHISFPAQVSSSDPFDFDRPKISSLSHRWKQEQPKAQFSTESRIWRRILLQQQKEQEGTSAIIYDNCKNETGKNGVNHDSLVDETSSMKRLPPCGFRETVRTYIKGHERNTSLRHLPSTSMYCIAPSLKPLCRSLKYTVVIYSSRTIWFQDQVENSSNSSTFDHLHLDKMNQYWRNIVVGAMKFLAHDSVERVNLVLREENGAIDATFHTNSTVKSRRRALLKETAKRNKYAKRIFGWSRKGVVNVVAATSLWDAIDQLESPSESILFIDGDHPSCSSNKNMAANGTVLQHRFRLWRELPNTLVIPKENGKTSELVDKNSAQSLACNLPSLHEMFVHTNYLCYLNHLAVGSELRDYTDFVRMRVLANDRTRNGHTTSWDLATIAMGMLLFSIADAYLIDDHHHSTATFNDTYRQPDRFCFEKYDDVTLKAFSEEISNYFGCPCPMATRVFPSNIRKCPSS